MKISFLSIIAVIFLSCNSKNKAASEQITADKELFTTPTLVALPPNLESRRLEFEKNINAANQNIINFASQNGWEALTEEPFLDSLMVFDQKSQFNKTYLKLVEADATMQLPNTYCGALEKRTLIAVTPEYYAKVYPQGIEAASFEKLLTHEIAHQLHIRILNDKEEEMGPLWFFEGFAIFAADQFSKSDLVLAREEMIDVMKNPERGSYLKYNYIFRYFVKKIPLKELILKAKNEDFNEFLISKID